METSTRIEILAGIAGSGKTTHLLEIYRSALREGMERAAPGAALWLAPTHRAVAQVRDRLLDATLPAAFAPNLATFDGFADQVLKFAPRPATSLSPAMRRILLRRIVAELARQNRLVYFRKIAETSGFLDLVAAFISELKRSHTWPAEFEKACESRGMRLRDRELAAIYARYQEALVAGQVYDGEGRFWSAREALSEGHWGRFSNLSLVVADGFTDFTEAQYRILELLARKAGRLVVSLLSEDPSERADLFAKTSNVIARLRAGETASVLVSSTGGARRTGTLPHAIDTLARRLFSNPRDLVPSNDSERIEVIAVAGEQREVALLAARIKRLVLDGVSPAEIVIAIRDLDGYAPLVDEVFSASGIPFACEAALPMARLPPFKTLMNVLALELEDWPVRRLLGLLNSGLFQPDWGPLVRDDALRDAAAALRAGEVPDGRERILESLERPAQPAGTPATAEQIAARRVSKLLRRLSDVFRQLRKTHDLTGWSAVIASLARELGFDRIPLDHETSEGQRAFGDLLAAILFDAAKAEQVAGIEPSRLTLKQFTAELTDLAQQQHLGPPAREDGRVRVLDAEQVRNLDVPYLFLAGLSERSFPRHRADDCLYTEGERRELNQFGLSLGHRAARTQEELLMFYGIVTRARKRLVLTYPVVTSEGQPLSPTPYLSSLLELFALPAGTGDSAEVRVPGKAIGPEFSRIQLRGPQGLEVQLEEQLEPIPESDRVLSAADVRVRAMFDCLAGRPALLGAVCRSREMAPAACNSLAAAEMNVRRFHTHGFTNFEGLLENPKSLDALHERFSPEHEFSATALEAYAQCPFRFLLKNVLRLEPLDSPEIETDFGRRGTLVHDVLAELHRALFVDREPARGAGYQVPGGDEISQKFQELVEQKLGAQVHSSDVHRALDRIERRMLAEWGVAYGEQWDDFLKHLPPTDAPPMPAFFEVAFGRQGAAREGTVDQGAAGQTAAPEQAPGLPPLVVGAGSQAVRIEGRIDRIDVGRIEGRPAFAVIDYKTGRRVRGKFDRVDSGRTLQLPLYTLAVSRLGIAGPGATPWQMGYWLIRETGFVPDGRAPRADAPFSPIETAVWEALVKTLDDIIPRLAAGVRAGRFPVYNADPDCTAGCPYRTICRVAEIRALPPEMGKEWQP